ncbi:MAG: peptide chain release factor 1 [Planctomycetes bacterium]|nr:peptide chain release factor 1 [Planctomycetota bacterium]
MRPKLDETEKRYQALKEQSEKPNFYNDQNTSTKVMKDIAWLKPIVDNYGSLKKLEEDLAEAQIMLADPDMKELAEEELPIIKTKLAEITDELIGILVTSDDKSNRNSIVEIHAGTGGDEAALFCGDLFKMYVKYSEIKGWKVEILDSNTTDLRGYKEITFMLRGNGVYQEIKYETGGHRVQRVPKTEAQGRVHTSAVKVTVLPEVEDAEIEINSDDLRIDRFCASGKGGQHVNRTASAVRVTHLPTNIVVSCQDERSQHQNLARAMGVLRSKLYELQQQKKNEEMSDMRAASGSGDRSQKVRTYNYPQNRVTDHRLGKNFSLEMIMDGSMKKLIDDLRAWEKAELLANF